MSLIHDVSKTNALRDDLVRAKEYANHLEGGDLSLEEQQEITDMLTKLISRKKCVSHRESYTIHC